MRMMYRKAILSYSMDLTDPDDLPVPVGALLICELGEERAAVTVLLEPSEGLDSFSREHLSDALAIVREHIDRFVAENPAAPSQEILGALHNALRNSLFVSEIGDPRVVDLAALCGEEISR